MPPEKKFVWNAYKYFDIYDDLQILRVFHIRDAEVP